MNDELQQQLNVLEKKVDATYQSAEKTRKYILGMLLATVIGFLLPLLGLILIIPWFLQTITATYGI